MMWYFLYPLRGTTLPPRLPAEHPVHRAFYRHGKTTATHWLIAMLVSVAIGVTLTYPTVFLSENPTAGFTSLPHHVWTSAKSFDGGLGSQVDIELRQVWIHGSYMKALDKDVLANALVIQNSLIQSDQNHVHDSAAAGDTGWGFHSPLMYWNNSMLAIEEDGDILSTVNEQAYRVSLSDFTLRPASVFAGKLFTNSKLLAADALVVTLFDTVMSSGERRWDRQIRALAEANIGNWTLYPGNGTVSRSQLYEFSFQPLSLSENVALAFAYGCMVLYVIISLRRLKAFHSRFGLVVTAVTQMTTSILASFTICGILRINLAQVPQNAYPFVVLVIGLENMFRLINAVLAYPPGMRTDLRIANALGDVGHLTIATAAQNLAILWLLSRIVSPGVAAFCAFAAVALLFDLFFLLTFFVAVLTVDIRRLELRDSLTRSNAPRATRKTSPHKRTGWTDALVQGRLPFSTRMAGTAVTTTFVLSLNYHFFDNKDKRLSFRQLLGLVGRAAPSIVETDSASLPPMNATRTPAAWLRLQNYDTAREVMRKVRPGGHSFVARMFDPLIVVVAGSDRTGLPTEQAQWKIALRSFAVEYFYPFAVAVVFVVAFVTVLMHFLLWNDVAEEHDATVETPEEPLSLETINLPHRLDIVKLESCESGHFVSIGLDRTMAISLFDKTQRHYTTTSVPVSQLTELAWPVHALAIDTSGNWVACHCADNQVLLYDRLGSQFRNDTLQYPDDHPPVLFTFACLHLGSSKHLHNLVVTSGGRISMLAVDRDQVFHQRLSEEPLLGAAVVEIPNANPMICVVTEEAQLVMYSFHEHKWNETRRLSLGKPTSQRCMGIVNIKPMTKVDLIVVHMAHCIVVLDIQVTRLLSSFSKLNVDAVDRELLFGCAVQCPSCRARSPSVLACAYADLSLGKLSLQQVQSEEAATEFVCLHAASPGCNSLGQAKATDHEIYPAGVWTTTAQAVVGVRRREEPTPKESQWRNGLVNGIVRRQQAKRKRNHSSDGIDDWEAYSVSATGQIHTMPLQPPQDDTQQECNASLYVNHAGPACTLDSQSAAIAFGNVVKVIKVAQDRQSRPNARSLAEFPSTTTQRRYSLRKAQ